MHEHEQRLRWPKESSILLTLGFFALLSLVIFGGSIRYGFTLGDDQFLVVTNLFVRGLNFTNLKYVFTHYDPELYMPFTFVTYQLNYAVAGLGAGFYHFTNIAFHALNAALITWLTFLLSKNKVAAVLAGILFCVHPIVTESVVWVAGRKDVLSTALFLFSLIGYLYTRTNHSKVWYWISIGAYLLALLAKASVMTLPLLLLLSDFGIENRKSTIALWKEKFPYLILAIVFAIIAWLGKGRIVHASTLFETFLMSLKSTIFYIQKILWPTNLSPAYAYHDPILLSSPDFYVPALLFLVLIGLLIVSLRFSRWPTLAALWFMITLAPTFFNFHKGEITYVAVDRYAYVPFIGLAMLVSVWFVHLSKNHRSFKHWGVLVIAILSVFSLIVVCVRQVRLWKTDETLLAYSLKAYPDSIPLRIALSVIYREEGRIPEEKAVLEKGLKYREDVAYRVGLGSIEARLGNIDAARAQYEKAKSLDTRNPEPLFYLGALEEQAGNTDKALELYTKAYTMDESYVAAYNNAGAILMERGEIGEAADLFEKSLTWNASFMEAHYNLFQIYDQLRKPDLAFSHLLSAYALAPENPTIGLSLGYKYFEKKDYAKARPILEKVLEEDSENHTAKRLLDLIGSLSK